MSESSGSDHWNYTSYDSCAEAALLGLPSEGWSGHESFHICADDIIYDKDEEISTPQLIREHWAGIAVREYWKDDARRATADNSKAKRLLGFVHKDERRTS